jgi:hypothetical protein
MHKYLLYDIDYREGLNAFHETVLLNILHVYSFQREIIGADK